MLLKSFRFGSNQPVSYQVWKNHHQDKRKAGHFHYCYTFDHPKFRKLQTNIENLTISLWNQTDSRLSPVLGSKKCTAMSLFNLAESEWISIDCLHRLPVNVVCFDEAFHAQLCLSCNNSQNKHFHCKYNAVRQNETCHHFTWFDGKRMSADDFALNCTLKCKMKPFSSVDAKQLDFVFTAVSNKNFTLLFAMTKDEANVTEHFYHRTWFKIAHTENIALIEDTKGYQICSSPVIPVIILFGNVFVCTEGEYISSLFVLDGVHDCQGTPKPKVNQPALHKNRTSGDELCLSPNINCPIFCQVPECYCSPLHFKTREGKCVSYFHLEGGKSVAAQKSSKDLVFKCCDNLTINKNLLNDLIVDCNESVQDEPMYADVLTNFTVFKCSIPGQIPCLPRHSKCYNISDICIYQLNTLGHLTPCRIGSHLESCHSFECNIHHKCPDSYCIPWHFVCDGNWDCPLGQDESEVSNKCTSRMCTFLFRCHSSSKCIHPEHICDEKIHCPQEDDELMCHPKIHTCPQQCHCFNLALSCVGVVLNNITLDFNVRSIHVTESRTDNLRSFGLIASLVNANFSGNHIIHICSSSTQFPNFVTFDISKNHVLELCTMCFHNLEKLQWIILKNNMLRNIQERSFLNLTSAKYIDLSQNFLNQFHTNTFENIPHLVALKLSSNLLENVEITVFDNLYIKNLVTTSVFLCCISPPGSSCHSTVEVNKLEDSCSVLLVKEAVPVLVGILCSLLLLANCLSIFLHTQKSSESDMYNIMIRTLNIGYFVFGIYLETLFVADLYFKKEFVVRQSFWTSFFVCHLAFALHDSSSIFLTLMLALLSLGRLMVTIFPLNSQFKTESFVTKQVAVGFVIAVCLPTGLCLSVEFSGKSLNKFCTHLVPNTDLDVVSNFSTNMIQTSLACFIIICDSLLIRRLERRDKSLHEITTGHRNQKCIPLKILSTSVPNILCWTSLFVVNLVFQILPGSHVDLLLWPIAVIRPLNGIINPSIFLARTFKLPEGCKTFLS